MRLNCKRLSAPASAKSKLRFWLAVSVGVVLAAPAAAETTLIPSGAEFTYSVGYIVDPMMRIGEAATRSLKPQNTVAPLFVPAGNYDNFTTFESNGAPNQGRAPFGDCSECQTRPMAQTDKRIAWLRARRSFPAPPKTAKVLLLRLRMMDGVIVRLNGTEIARRNWPDSVGPPSGYAPARRPNGAQWQTIRVPVSSLPLTSRNTIAVEVRPSARRTSFLFDLSLAAEDEVGIVRGPMVQRVTESSAIILFRTALASKATVEYGPTSALGNTVESAGGGFAERHRVKVSGTAGQRLYYRVKTPSQTTQTRQFALATKKDAPVRFVVYGDMRNGHHTHKKIVNAIVGEAPAFVINTGDLVQRGSDAGDWQTFFSTSQPLLARVPYYPVAGNHDVGRAGSFGLRLKDLFALWPQPADAPRWGHWHSFDVSGIHFVMLDSNAYEDPRQLRWVAQDLAAARSRGVRAIIAVTHHGPYSRGPHMGHEYAMQHYVPLMRQYKIDMFFSGHDHLYQRGRIGGLNYIVTGGGGAPLYPIRCGSGKSKRCPWRDGFIVGERVHHYVVVTLAGDKVRYCPKKADGSAVERCISLSLRRYP